MQDLRKYALLDVMEDLVKEEKPVQKEELIHKMSMEKTAVKSSSKNIMIALVAVVLLGVGTGYFVSNAMGKGPGAAVKKYGAGSATDGAIKKGYTAGVNDIKQFPDVAEGELKEGGIDGEGQYHLVRPGGDSQNVYLTSSTVDLSLFVGRKVKVWGSTQTAQKAGWLMDVGKLEVQ